MAWKKKFTTQVRFRHFSVATLGHFYLFSYSLKWGNEVTSTDIQMYFYFWKCLWIYMLNSFHEKLRVSELRNLRSLTLVSAIIVIIVGFIFEFSYHDSLILASGISCSTVLIGCYFLSFYSKTFKRHFLNIAFFEVFLINTWALLVIWQRNFEIDVLLPVSISVFTFSLVFNSFYKSLIFVFSITTALLILMLLKGNWQNHFTILILSLYAGAFLSQQILKRKAEFHSEIQKKEKLNLVRTSDR